MSTIKTTTFNTIKQPHLMPFDDVFQFPEQFWFYVRAQVDDRSCQAVVLKNKKKWKKGKTETFTIINSNMQENIYKYGSSISK